MPLPSSLVAGRAVRTAAALLCIGLSGAVAHAGPPRFTVSSPTFRPGAPLPPAQVLDGFGCTGANRSPALQWTDPPPGTQSFAITLYDPDAPTGSGWWHWVVYDLPGDLRALPEGAGRADGSGLPAGALQGRTDFGAPGFGGACPPAGAGPHRYRLQVHALKVPTLPVPPDASAAMVGFLIRMNRLGVAELQVRHGR
jgi:Raf kinase inhibitor-like YbhB/YbcL family protein